MVLFNPYLEREDNAIDAVDFHSEIEGGGTQVIRVSLKEQQAEDQIVVNASMNDIARKENLYQKGLLSIVRRKLNDKKPLFLFTLPSGCEK